MYIYSNNVYNRHLKLSISKTEHLILIPTKTSSFLNIYHFSEWQYVSDLVVQAPNFSMILPPLFFHIPHPIHQQILLAPFSEYIPNPSSSYHCHVIQGFIISWLEYCLLTGLFAFTIAPLQTATTVGF